MISVSSDISRDPKQKSDFDTLTGKITIHDFNDKLKELLPNFHHTVVYQRRMPVGASLELLHKLTYMPGEPFSANANVRDDNLPEYLHSLLLGIHAHKARIEAIYTPID